MWNRLNLKWSRNCVISEILRTPEGGADNQVSAKQTRSTTFQKNNDKFYIPVVNLSINDNIKLIQNIKQGSKRAISWKNIDLI